VCSHELHDHTHVCYYCRGGLHLHHWIKRSFSLVDRVLYCRSGPITNSSSTSTTTTAGTTSSSKSGKLKRAIVLNHATIEHTPAAYKDGKYKHYFDVRSPMGNWRLRADSEADAVRWVEALKAAVEAPPMILSIEKVRLCSRIYIHHSLHIQLACASLYRCGTKCYVYSVCVRVRLQCCVLCSCCCCICIVASYI
jgi:PH domain